MALSQIQTGKNDNEAINKIFLTAALATEYPVASISNVVIYSKLLHAKNVLNREESFSALCEFSTRLLCFYGSFHCLLRGDLTGDLLHGKNC
ncbi:MAG: hypothetical protein HY231_02025 [Acidobacteria bacterium]|nr:hypothetical protein [Acidobacteriota bacterium]